jgi:hypothetical protein
MTGGREFVCVKCGLVVELPVLRESFGNVALPASSKARTNAPELRCPDATCRGRLKRDRPDRDSWY